MNVRVSPPPEYPGGPLTPTPLGSNANAAYLLRQQFATGGVLGSIRFQGPGAAQAAAAAAAGGGLAPYAAVMAAGVPISSNPAYVTAAPNLVSAVQLTQQQLHHPDSSLASQQVPPTNSNVLINSPNKNNNHRT